MNWAWEGGRKTRKSEQVIASWPGDGRGATLPEKRAVGPCMFEDKRRKTGWGELNYRVLCMSSSCVTETTEGDCLSNSLESVLNPHNSTDLVIPSTYASCVQSHLMERETMGQEVRGRHVPSLLMSTSADSVTLAITPWARCRWVLPAAVPWGAHLGFPVLSFFTSFGQVSPVCPKITSRHQGLLTQL